MRIKPQRQNQRSSGIRLPDVSVSRFKTSSPDLRRRAPFATTVTVAVPTSDGRHGARGDDPVHRQQRVCPELGLPPHEVTGAAPVDGSVPLEFSTSSEPDAANNKGCFPSERTRIVPTGPARVSVRSPSDAVPSTISRARLDRRLRRTPSTCSRGRRRSPTPKTAWACSAWPERCPGCSSPPPTTWAWCSTPCTASPWKEP